ncbi:hypothetical protein ACO0LG_08015 [Undibacterium sp. Ji42W]|uniref:hypothetical protein n=1 Tax=Undibacterium sp. Ji42W TaxID=3413039 RepID=UPI003BF34ABD
MTLHSGTIYQACSDSIRTEQAAFYYKNASCPEWKKSGNSTDYTLPQAHQLCDALALSLFSYFLLYEDCITDDQVHASCQSLVHAIAGYSGAAADHGKLFWISWPTENQLVRNVRSVIGISDPLVCVKRYYLATYAAHCPGIYGNRHGIYFDWPYLHHV